MLHLISLASAQEGPRLVEPPTLQINLLSFNYVPFQDAEYKFEHLHFQYQLLISQYLNSDLELAGGYAGKSPKIAARQLSRLVNSHHFQTNATF